MNQLRNKSAVLYKCYHQMAYEVMMDLLRVARARLGAVTEEVQNHNAM